LGYTHRFREEIRPMDIDGTYGFVYCGNRGLGAGVFSINGDRFEGRDLAGGSYNGTATQDGDGNIVLEATLAAVQDHCEPL
jgi:hypothetical protein